MIHRFLTATALVALLALPCGIAAAQDGGDEPTPEKDEREIPDRALKEWGEKQKEKVESGEAEADEDPLALFQSIVEDMGEVEDQLGRASAGRAVETSEEVIEGIDELLGQTDEESEEIVQDIIRLIEMAKVAESQQQQQQQKQQKQRQRSQQRGKGKPQNQQAKSQQNDNSSSPATSAYDPSDSIRRGENRRVGDEADRWGNLPPKLRDRMNQEDVEGFPEEYRDKLEKYFKRLSRESNR